MSICSGIGNGIGGAIGKWGAGLGSALGLGTVVDVGVRAYTGYGLLETLTVPYIECPDGSFSSAIEWYSSGLKCPVKKPDPSNMGSNSKSSHSIGEDYAKEIEALGGAVFPYIAYHSLYLDADRNSYADDGKFTLAPGFFDFTTKPTDTYGNTLNEGKNLEGRGDSQVFNGFYSGNLTINEYGFGGWGSMLYPAGITYKGIRTETRIKQIWDYNKSRGASLVGLRISLPSLPYAPPAANIPPPRGFSPNPPRKNKEDCEEVSCPCITPADIEKAVKRALGLSSPFAPEKLVREMGAKMFAAPGPSLVPIVPTTLVDAIAAIQATTYMRAGYARYPVVMPKSLINDDSIADAVPTEPLENFAEWFEWFIKQYDATTGEWPVDIAIIDGVKRQPLKFENISEALSEIAGMVLQAATDADAGVAVASHGAVAATKAQTAAVIAQKNVECLIKFFGVRTGYGSIFVDAVITPMDSDDPSFNLKKFLTPSKQSIGFYTDNDPFDFQAVLDRILRNSEISKASVAMDASKEIVGDYARNQRKYDATEAKKAAEKELEKLEADLKSQNPEMNIKIRVDTPDAGEIQGNNFVIKRPQQ